MKGLEFILLGTGALAGAFLRYKFVSSTMVIGTLPVNILIVNVIGSFILGVFSILSTSFNLDANIHCF
jgi:CrcB protein